MDAGGPYGFTGQQLRHGVRPGRLHLEPARSGIDGRHGVFVGAAGGAHGLPQPARRGERPRPGRRRDGDAGAAQERAGRRRRACCRRPDAARRSTRRPTDSSAPRVARSCCSSGCRMRCATVTGFWPWSAAPPPIQDGRTRNIATPSRDAQVAASGRRWPRRAWTPTPSAWSRRTAPAPRSATRSSSTAWPRCTAPTARVPLGSAKSNFGHTESAAGALGLIKAILALQHGVVPPMVHFNRLPDALAQIETGLFVPQEITPWPTGGQRAAPGGGVVVRDFRHQRARHRRAGARDRPRPTGADAHGRRAHAVPAVLDFGRRTAPHRAAGWPTGWSSTRIRSRCRTWPTRWLAGAGTARCAPP